MRTPLLAALLLLGCNEPDPRARTAPEYVERLEPLLYENGFLATRVLETAAGVYNDGSGPDEIEKVWADEIVPLARHLADQATITVAPTEWSDRHTELIEAWSLRADAYAAIELAVEDGDREAWKTARRQADDAKLREEEWFRSMNRELAPLGLMIDQFP